MVDTHRSSSGLVDRAGERRALEGLVAGVRAGQSRVLVLRGEAGVGKTALLRHLSAAADGCRVARAAGVENEMELAFAGLHALCAPMLDRLGDLPGPQRDALSTTFGLSAGPAPDRFLVGLAVLSLLADAADERPLVCIVDDAQWLDRVSAQTLAFVARRLLAERVGLVFALRDSSDDEVLEGLPELVVGGLAPDDAWLLVDETMPGPLDERVKARILGEARGNPLALIELPRGFTPAELAGGFALPDARPLANRLEHTYLRRVQTLPRDTQLLLLTAAAEPLGHLGLLWRAAEILGIDGAAAGPAEVARLIELGLRVRFTHPLVRPAVYQASIEHLGRSRAAIELARARLLYGEWLRRENRRTDAREQLRAAHERFSRAGAAAFAERARRELLATGETVRRTTPGTRDGLTPQEVQDARLARDGHTNPEIGAELFISPRTVECHLHKVFRKLDVSTRK